MNAAVQGLSVQSLSQSFPSRQRGAPDERALDDVSFDVAPGEIVGVVGESGSGKSTLFRAIAGLLTGTRGTIRLDGEDVLLARGNARRAIRRKMGVVFQNPETSLDPRWTVRTTLNEVLSVCGVPRGARDGRIVALLDQVQLTSDALPRRPSALSGGERQRVALARALANQPRLLMADEPFSALDRSTRASVLETFRVVGHQSHCATLVISHDLDVVDALCSRVLVLHAGRLVESWREGPLRHPYSRALQAARLTLPPTDSGDLPPLAADAEPSATGCAFQHRCPLVHARCREQQPPLHTDAQGSVACWAVEIDG